MPVIGFEVNGEEQVKLGITRLYKDLDDLSAPVGSKPSLWDRWHAAFFMAETELFKSQGGTGRKGTWAPLNPKYAAWKAAHAPGSAILVLTGAMRQSLVSNTAGHVYRPKPDSLEVGTTEKAGWHWDAVGQRPARRAIDIGPAAEREFFGRAMAEWGADLRREWSRK